MKPFLALCFVALLSFLIVPQTSKHDYMNSGASDNIINQPVEAEENNQNETENIPPFNEQVAKKNASSFMEALKQDIDDQYKVVHFSSKKELVTHLENYVSEDIANKYTDGLFEEKEGSLYIIPTDLPPWLKEDEPVEIKQLSPKSYRVYQQNTSELYGTYNVTLGYEYLEGKWLITFASID